MRYKVLAARNDDWWGKPYLALMDEVEQEVDAQMAKIDRDKDEDDDTEMKKYVNDSTSDESGYGRKETINVKSSQSRWKQTRDH